MFVCECVCSSTLVFFVGHLISSLGSWPVRVSVNKIYQQLQWGFCFVFSVVLFQRGLLSYSSAWRADFLR